jgi:hypothetical protein
MQGGVVLCRGSPCVEVHGGNGGVVLLSPRSVKVMMSAVYMNCFGPWAHATVLIPTLHLLLRTFVAVFCRWCRGDHIGVESTALR